MHAPYFITAKDPMPKTSAPGSLTYRPDIDGLRAVAVIPVVLYHFRAPGFGGGFVGVDIFFVISGFLITSLLFSELRAGEFSILRFYERRARRIFPALFAVIAASLAAGTAVFFPRDLLRLAESAAATALFVSNFDFWLQSGYFDVGADLKPLLHTWSLAVEEQFYVVFPALLYAMHTRKRVSLLLLVSALAILSFGLSVWAVARYPSAAFYLAPYRTWELMLGAILALGEFPGLKWPWVDDLLSVSGLLAIGWAVFGFTSQTPFPGPNALVPCLGTGALIFAGKRDGGNVQRILASRPLVFVGLVSYSFYLWHWPVHVFANYVLGSSQSIGLTVALILLSFGLAVLSWRFIEQPFRRRQQFSRRTTFQLGGLATATSLAIAGVLFGVHGLPQRFSPDTRKVLAEADDIEPNRHDCFNRTVSDVQGGNICAIGDLSAARSTFILWGDSHADALLPAVEAAARRFGRKGLFIGHGRCPPLIHISLTDEPTERCAQLNDAALRLALGQNISLVILAARWAYYDQGVGYGPDGNEVRHLIDLDPAAMPASSQHVQFAHMLERTVRALRSAGKAVVIVAPVPEPGIDVPEALGRDASFGLHEVHALPFAAYHARDAFVLSDLDGLHRRYAVQIVDPAQFLCSAEQCALLHDGRPLYVDHHHLSVFGALEISGLFASAFQNQPKADLQR